MTDLAEGAAGIGRQLCATAIHHGVECTWLSADLTVDGTGVETRPAGADVYEGTAGIALFLAQLAVAMDESESGRVARAAARHALSRADRVEPAYRFGFHTGVPGIAATTARVGLLLDDDELVERAVELSAAVTDVQGTEALDVV